MSRPPHRLLPLLSLLLLAGCSAPEPGPWEETAYGRTRLLAPAQGGGAGFTRIAANRSGVDFENSVSPERRIENQLLTHGSGVAIGDVDGDGLADVYLARIDGPNALYRNLGGWEFEDVTAASGTALEALDATGVAFADFDGDGDLDLFVGAKGQANALLLNDGSGVFTDATASAGIGDEGGATTPAIADIDGDGDLDLYVTNYKWNKVGSIYPPQETGFDQVVRNRDGVYEIEEKFVDWYRAYVEPEGIRLWQFGEADNFYLNDGTGVFTELDWTGGRFVMENGQVLDSVPEEWGLAARFHDVNGDLRPDLYVSNDFESPDQFWINQPDGTFRSIDPFAVRTTSASSMAVDFSDVDRDGELDFFVVDMAPRDPVLQRTQMPQIAPTPVRPGEIEPRLQRNRNTLFLSDGAGGWQEVARAAGVEASGWSWGTLFADVDLDGYEDIVVTTGHVWDVLDADTNQRLLNTTVTDEWQAVVNNFPSLEIPNTAFRNRGDGTFEEVSTEWGLDLGPDISHGLATGDLDGDGDLDLVLNRLFSEAAFLRNDASAERLSVSLRGEGSNRFGIGARIRVVGDGPDQVKELSSGGLYLSSPEPLASFAAAGAREIVVEWPSGRVSRVPAEPGRHFEIHEERATETRDPASGASETTAPLFEQTALGHTHVENSWNDFERQPLLPHRLSQMGPGLTWDDVDGDGDPDLIVPSGAGGRLAVLRNDGGRFTRTEGPAAGDLDQVATLPLPGGSGELLLASSIYEAPTPEVARSTPGGVWLDVGAGGAAARGPALPASTNAIGALAAADLDGDGSLELFVGTRTVPVAYPQPVGSRIFELTADGIVLDSVATRDVSNAGLVSGATFSDIDGDGDPDLVLAEDWGRVRIFLNVGGRLSDVTDDWGIGALRGRWNGVASGDFDGDGRMDLIATSWGRNTRHRPTPERPLRLYWGDFDGSGGLDMVEAVPHPETGDDIPTYDLSRLTTALPYVRRQQTRTFREFADADLRRVLGDAVFESARVEEVVTLDHHLLLNRGGGFEAVPLPDRAQFAPAFHPAVADLDGDGNEDLFLSQNFFPNELNVQRYGAGRGLVLLGDGAGGFRAMAPSASGVRVFGDQRGAALADVDADGRVDVAVSQNGAETILLRNRTALPGLRVRLQGGPGNPRAAGAVLRLRRADGSLGPAREVHLGTGYWSVDDAVVVLGGADGATGLEVRWPDGTTRTVDFEPGTTEIRVRQEEGA